MKRCSNIELLRILLGIFVIALHINNPSDGAAITYASENRINEAILIIIEMASICAVNVFLLISGYFLTNSHKRNYWKILELFLQCIIFMIVKYMIYCTLNINHFSIKDLLINCIPNNYFITLYSTTYLVSTIVDYGLDLMDRVQLKKIMIGGIVVFSVIPTMLSVVSELFGKDFSGLNTIGIGGSQRGYTIVNFLLLYVIGACLRRLELKINCSMALIGYGCSLTGLFVWQILYMKRTGGLWGSALTYCNILVILESIFIFLFFLELPVKNSAFINHYAKATFVTYLCHGVILKFIPIKRIVGGENSGTIMIVEMVMAYIAVSIICYGIYIIWEKGKSLCLGLVQVRKMRNVK